MLPADTGANPNAGGAVLVCPTISSVVTAGTAGTTTYGYIVTALNGQTVLGPVAGQLLNAESQGSAEVTVTTGNATLGVSNYNVITWGAVTSATSYNLYGNTAGSETLIATGLTALNYHDTGSAAPNGVTAAPTTFNYPAPHCPMCGSGMILVNQAHITAVAGTAAGSQTPRSVNGVYVTNTQNSQISGGVTSAYTHLDGEVVYPHAFKTLGGQVLKGSQITDEANVGVGANSITPESINATEGP